MEKMDRGEVRKLLAEGKTPQEVVAILEARQAAAVSSSAVSIDPASPTALYGTPPSAAPAPDVAPPIVAAPDKEKHELNKDGLLTYIREYSTAAEGVILDQGVFASQFNIPITAAQRLVNTLVKKGILDAEHKVIINGLVAGDISEAEIAETIKEPVVAVVTPDVVPKAPERKYGFTNRELLEFLKTKAGTTFSNSTLLENFNLSKEHAAEVIRDLKQARIIGDDNKVMDGATLEKAEKDFEGHPTETLDDEYTFVQAEESAAFSVPTTAKTSTPIVTPPEVSTVKPTAVSDLDFDLNEPTPAAAPTPDTAPVLSATPVALTTDPLVGVVPGAPDYEPADPEERNTFLSGLGDKAKAIISWVKIPPSMKNSRAYALAAVIALAGGGFATYNLTHRDEQAKPAAEKTEPKPEASKPAQKSPEANKDAKALDVAPNPNYEKSDWWKMLDAEVQETAKGIIEAKSAEDYAVNFFKGDDGKFYANDIQNRPIELSENGVREIFKKVNGNGKLLNDVYFGVKDETLDKPFKAFIPNCAVQVKAEKDEPSGPESTCYVQVPFAQMAKSFHTVGIREMIWAMGEKLEEGKTVSETFAINRKKIIEMVNEHTK